ncbi:DUF58 domain-containing protein [Gluconobacter morbifer]|uniref:DUF58 domain-containing protein n=1 Tax=Gluconobacter morbifer TaxID=479935 RepID=UPI001FE0433C|nr:DUF58 domain-containing protein [Gluconobacter morbifer]
MTAPAEALPLPALVLHAERIASSLYAGVHGRRRTGSGEDFWQFRPYHPGEPATAIDWRQSARSPMENTFWVRERERENAQSLMLWCDPSASMEWRSSNALPTKEERARLCTLALAAAALRGGERVGLLTGPETGRAFAGRQVLPRLAEALLHPRENEPDLPPVALIPTRADLVVVSDFLWEEDRIDAFLRDCSRHPVRTHLLCILDPEERSLHQAGRIRFEGLEGGVLTLSAMESLDQAYDQAMTAHLDALTRSAASLHVDCILHNTSHDPLPALLALHMAMGAGR